MVSHSLPFCPNRFSLQTFITMSHWSGPRPRAFATPSILVLHQAPLRYPVVALCHGDPAALNLQGQPFDKVQQFRGGVDVGVGQLKALDLESSSWMAGLSPCQLSWAHTTRASFLTSPRWGTGLAWEASAALLFCYCYFFVFVLWLLFFGDRISMCSSGYPGIL